MKKHIYILALALSSASFAYGQTAEEYLNQGNSKAGLNDYKGAIADYNQAYKSTLNMQRLIIIEVLLSCS